MIQLKRTMSFKQNNSFVLICVSHKRATWQRTDRFHTILRVVKRVYNSPLNRGIISSYHKASTRLAQLTKLGLSQTPKDKDAGLIVLMFLTGKRVLTSSQGILCLFSRAALGW